MTTEFLPPHMSSDQFREQGHRLIDWIADYWERIESFPVRSRVEPGEVAAMLPDAPPETGESWDAIVRDIDRIVVPGLTHWQSPNFFAFFPANASGPAVLGDLLSTGLGVQGMLWATSPACTEIETKVLDWLADMIGLPERFTARSGTGGGVIQGTASEAVLVAIVAARHRALAAGRTGDLVAYASGQAHSSILKSALIAGLDRENVREIDVDDTLALRPDALETAIRNDIAAGRTPFFVCATVGTTSTTAIDPLEKIGEVARAHDLWLHVDAAYAGSACVCPEHRWLIAGADAADSFNFNPHKWLLTNFDLSAFWVADRAALIDAMSITPEYLRNAASDTGAVIDYRDWHVPLGRRFRALKLWFVIRHYGVEGLRAHIREHVRLAEWFEEQVRADDRFELAAPRPLALVCFRLRARPGETGESQDARNRALLDALNESGDIFLTHTTAPAPDESGRLIGEPRVALRMAIGATQTREEHVRRAWELIRASA